MHGEFVWKAVPSLLAVGLLLGRLLDGWCQESARSTTCATLSWRELGLPRPAAVSCYCHPVAMDNFSLTIVSHLSMIHIEF